MDHRTLARSSPAGLAWWHSGGKHGESLWTPARHLTLLSQRIVDVASGRLPRLIVTMPPRHGKSELISRFTPAWFLGRFPNRKVILASYNDTFASHWGRKARDVLKEEQELFGVRLNSETSGGGQWELLPGRDGMAGVMVTAGVGGGITGKGADLLVIDDPVKNAEDAKSATAQEGHYDWWQSTARTRLQKGAGVILVMTRWNEADLAGQLLAHDPSRDKYGELLPPGEKREEVDGDEWEILNLPAFAERPKQPPVAVTKAWELLPETEVDGAKQAWEQEWTDEVGRRDGDVLWPEMFDAKWMEQTRGALGLYWFTALYMQKPAPAEGMLFKREHFHYFKREDFDATSIVTLLRDSGPEPFDIAYGLKFQTIDVAASENEQADFTVVSTWLLTPTSDLVWWRCDIIQFDSTKTPGFVERVYHEEKPAFIAIERLGHGLDLIKWLVRIGLPITRLEPDRDKVSRALVACARYEQGKVFHPERAPWLEDAERQLLTFPNAAHDDIVDTVAYAAIKAAEIGSNSMPRADSITQKSGRQLPKATDTPVAHTDQGHAVLPRVGSAKPLTGGVLTKRF